MSKPNGYTIYSDRSRVIAEEEKQMHIEQDCTVEHNGQSFTANGAVVSDEVVIGYLGKAGVLTDWHGAQIGTYRIVSKWRQGTLSISTWVYQITARVNGRTYKGRSQGEGMIFKGKLSK